MQTETNTRPQAPWRVVTNQNLAENYAEGPRIKVRCVDPRGLYYDFLRRRQGDVFYLVPQWITVVDPITGGPVKENGEVVKRVVTAEEQFNSKTMMRVEEETQENVTSAQGAINKMQDEMSEEKAPKRKSNA